MANKVTIDVEARFVDSVSDDAQKAAENVEDIGDAAKKAKKETDKLGKTKVKPAVDADDSKFLKKIRAAEEKARKLGKTKTATVLSAIDKASAIMNKVSNKAKGIAGKTWKGIVAAKDSASAILKNVTNLGKGIAGKTWTAIVKIKDTFTTPLTKLKNMLFNIKTLIGGIAAAWAGTKLVVNPINLADAYSSAQIGFSTLLGAEGGQAMMDKIDQFAKETPFKTSGVISNVQKMMAYGWDADRIIDDMKTIGDAAAATGKGDEGLSSIVYALSEIRSKGKLSTQELNQLASAGIKAKQYLAEGLGYGSDDEGLMKLSKDLESGAIGANQAIDLILEGMKEFDGMMDKTANETVAGLWSQIEDTFEINVFRKWGQGLQDGAKKGFGTIVDLLDSSEDAISDLGDTLYEVGKTASNWVADKLEKAVKTIKEITGSDEFKNANLGGKIKLLWDGVIGNPFSDWWENTVVPWWDKTAVPWLAEKANGIGKALGKGLTGGIAALLGLDATGALEDGVSIGGSFMEGFLEGFDTSKIGDALSNWVSENKGLATVLGTVLGIKLLSGLGSIVGNIKGLFGGGSGSTGLGSGTVGTMTVNAAVVNLNGGLGGTGTPDVDLPNTGTGSGTGTGTKVGFWGTLKGSFSKFFGSTGTATTAGTGLLGKLAGAGSALTGGAATGGAAAAVGGGSILGAILGAIGIGDGVIDFVNAGKLEKGSKERKDKMFQGGTKLAMVGGGAGAGAAAGAAIGAAFGGVGAVPGALIGAGIGGVGALFGGDAAGKALSDSTDEGGALSNAWEATKEFFGETIPTKWDEFWDGAGTFFEETIPTAKEDLEKKVSTFFTETIPEKWDAFWAGVGEFFTQTVPYAIGYAVGKIETFFTETLPEKWDAFWDDVGTFFTETLPSWAETTWNDHIVPFFTEDIPAFFGSLWTSIKEFFTETIPTWAETIWNDHVVPFFTETVPQWFGDLWTSIKEFFTETLPEWGDTIWNGHIAPFFTEDIPGFFSDLWDDLCQFFTEDLPAIGSTIWSNVKSFFTETVPGWFQSVWDNIKGSFTAGYEDGSGGGGGKKARGGIVGGGSSSMEAFARGGIAGYSGGGMVRGGAKLIKVAEEGNPEMIIPLGSQRRDRALKLWAKTGELLGVDKFARGGRTNGNDEGIPLKRYDADDSAGGQYVLIEVGGIHVEIHVNAQGSENIAEAIKAQANEIADTLAGIMADALGSQFENTPVTGGVA